MKNIFILFLSLTLFSCTTYVKPVSPSNNLTCGVVKSKIIKGETNQLEILEIFGSPNIVTKNKSNNEVWSYNRMRVNERAKGTYVFYTIKQSYSSSTTSFDLIISFTDDDIVSDYSVVSGKF